MPEDILSEIQQTEGHIAEAFRLLNLAPCAVRADQVEKVVVILGSSRSGSSLLFHLLSETGAFWSPQGEESAFHRLGGVGFARTTAESDAITATPNEQQIEIIRRNLMNDLGRGTAPVSDCYIAQSIARILVQWPEREWDLAEMIFVARTCLDGSDLAWGKFLSGLGINPAHYDGFGGEPPTQQARFVLEEPPFITQFPRHAPVRKLDAPLLLKTSSNVYRPELLRALFPQAQFKYILLTRNPAACINGLMDGWMSPAFHSHRVGDFARLNIAGYSEINPKNPYWWKFDLPPGWAAMIDRPLGEVCSFQWTSAYQHALNMSGEKFSFRFEDLLNEDERALGKLLNFCGVSTGDVTRTSAARAVMSSQPPAPGRWRRRQGEIEPLIRESSLREVARELGYNLDSLQDLI